MKTKLLVLLVTLAVTVPLPAAPARNVRPVFVIHVDYAPDAPNRGPSLFRSICEYLRYFRPFQP